MVLKIDQGHDGLAFLLDFLIAGHCLSESCIADNPVQLHIIEQLIYFVCLRSRGYRNRLTGRCMVGYFCQWEQKQ